MKCIARGERGSQIKKKKKRVNLDTIQITPWNQGSDLARYGQTSAFTDSHKDGQDSRHRQADIRAGKLGDRR